MREKWNEILIFSFSFFIFILFSSHLSAKNTFYCWEGSAIPPTYFSRGLSFSYFGGAFGGTVQIDLDVPFVQRNALCRYPIAYFGNTKNKATISQGLSLGLYISPCICFLFISRRARTKNKHGISRRERVCISKLAFFRAPAKAVYQLLKHKVKPLGIYKCFSSVFPIFPSFLLSFVCCPHQETGVLINCFPWTLRTSENKWQHYH